MTTFHQPFRQVHLDFHTSADCTQVGVDFNPNEFANNHLTDLSKRVGDIIYSTESADIAQLAADFKMNELALNASYSVAAKVTEGSILNFLK